MLALLALVLAQGPRGGPALTAAVDRARLTVGDALVLTVRARTRSSEPVTFTMPSFAGFAIVGTREITDVSVGVVPGAAARTTVRQLTLRAERAGGLVIGAVRARQGNLVLATEPITITVDRATGAAAVLTPPARALLDAAPPPASGDQVALTVLVPADTVLAGQQLDIVLAAWFPRELRLRLRGQPRLALPTPAGVWSFPEEAPDEPVAARQVRGHWMDVYVAHRIVFPLEPGRVTIPPAAVEYGVPLSFSIFSREERYSLHSDSVTIEVLPLPAEGRPQDDQRLAAGGLSLDLAVTPADTRVDEPVTVLATLTGVGNTPLWPEPALHWPAGFRVYPTETDVRLDPQSGLIAGTKTFNYLVVPDSAGTFMLGEVRYPYYDLRAGVYSVARTPPHTMVVLPGPEARAARPSLPLLTTRAVLWADVAAETLGPWGWVLIGIAPPLLTWVARRRRRPEEAVTARTPTLSRVGRLERDFHALLASHVPDREARDGDGLARALRASGIDRAVADHVMRLRDRLRAARYGPNGLGDVGDLVAELERMLQVLGAESGSRRRRILAGLMCVAIAASRPGAAQTPTAEALYDAGALRAAADSFAARAAAEPELAAHWYNLGATLYRAGADGKAVAAWTTAARLAPRNETIARARELIPPPDAASDPLLAVGVATPVEWALVAAVSWIALWVAIALGARRIAVGTTLAVTLVAAGFGALEAGHRARPVVVVVNAATPVRVAPYGSASATATVDAGAALLVAGRYGRWLAVRRDDGVRGWVLGAEVVRP
ncbi:MAG TPA: BatD family protein [Gemmatimonadales bacterium]|nr:BatD family protein [Gemmatimonadales bacterium]